jgi:F-type H+-transporting ATPase subunit epsilon
MKLRITTPTAVIAEFDDVLHLRAEDASGAFGILPRHADFLTVLEPSVVSWRRAGGMTGHCAVRGGVLTVQAGKRIGVATREAVLGDDLARLEAEALATFRAKAAEEQSARADAARLQLAAVRRMFDYLRPERLTSSRQPARVGLRRAAPR